MSLQMTPPWLKSARFRPEENASSTAPQPKRISCLRKALLSHICLPVFRVAGNPCSPEFLPTKQSWQTTAASSSILQALAQVFFKTIPFTKTCCTSEDCWLEIHSERRERHYRFLLRSFGSSS